MTCWSRLSTWLVWAMGVVTFRRWGPVSTRSVHTSYIRTRCGTTSSASVLVRPAPDPASAAGEESHSARHSGRSHTHCPSQRLSSGGCTCRLGVAGLRHLTLREHSLSLRDVQQLRPLRPYNSCAPLFVVPKALPQPSTSDDECVYGLAHPHQASEEGRSPPGVSDGGSLCARCAARCLQHPCPCPPVGFPLVEPIPLAQVAVEAPKMAEAAVGAAQKGLSACL